jgi:hypothetical protein
LDSRDQARRLFSVLVLITVNQPPALALCYTRTRDTIPVAYNLLGSSKNGYSAIDEWFHPLNERSVAFRETRPCWSVRFDSFAMVAVARLLLRGQDALKPAHEIGGADFDGQCGVAGVCAWLVKNPTDGYSAVRPVHVIGL